MVNPLFVKVEEYNEVVALLKQIENKLEETKRIIDQLNQIKSEEDGEISNWQQSVSLVEEKIKQISQIFSRV